MGTQKPTSVTIFLVLLITSLILPMTATAETVTATQRLPSTISRLLQEDVQFLQEETVVSALRHEQPISEAPANIHVITAEDIRHSGATDIPTLLRRVPGIEVMQMTAADFNVSTRGNNQARANKLLVMIDHRPINTDGNGNVIWQALAVSLFEIKQIEVLIGPASVLYGFNAFDGIVHIITKSPAEMPGTSVQVAGGELDTGLASITHAGQQDRFGYKFSGGWAQTHRWRDRTRAAFRTYRAHTGLDYMFSKSTSFKLAGGYRAVNDLDGIGSGSRMTKSQNSRGYVVANFLHNDFSLRSSWMQRLQESDQRAHSLLGGVARTTGPNGEPLRARFTQWNLETQHAVALEEWGRTTYGLNLRHTRRRIKINRPDVSVESRVGLFLQQELRFPHSWQIVAGVRYDIHKFIKPTWSPRISLIWAPIKDHSLLASYSIGYRPPSLFQASSDAILAVQPNPSSPRTRQRRILSDPNSLPEQITSYELGYQGWFSQHRMRIRANVFANLIRDLLSSRSGVEPGLQVLTNNKGKALIWGTELGVEFLATAWLEGFAHYSYQDIKKNFRDGSAVRRGGPAHKGTIGIRGNWNKRLSTEITYHYVSAATYHVPSNFDSAPLFGQPVPNPRVGSYSLLNIRVGYRFWDDNVEVAITAFNALNDRHKEHPLGETIGSRVLGWLTFRL